MKLITPLEELSQGFISPAGFDSNIYWRNRIVDDTEKQKLYIIPAGYTQRNSEGVNRSILYRSMYQKAISFNSEKKKYPLGKTHKVILKPEPSNPYDKFAVRIGIVFQDSSKSPPGFSIQTWKEIGYIPKLISKLILKNEHMLEDGKLIALHSDYQRQIYFGRIELPYGSSETKSYKNCNMKRISDILEG